MRKLSTTLFALLLFAATAFAQTETVVGIIVNSTAHDTLEAAVLAAGLDDDLSGDGPFTVFAPTDDAFAALPAGTVETLLGDSATLANILLFHVAGLEALSTDLSDGQRVMTLQGGDVVVTINADGVFINDAQVTMADVDATNGVVHVIDAVLSPPPATVVDIIVESEVHTTLETAVGIAGLADALSGAGPFTVFAPTDEAFLALPPGVLAALTADSAALANVLLYHAVGAEAYSDDLEDGQRIMTLQGGDVVVTINDDGIFINDAEVTVANLQALNGVVHVIDAVLTPPPATVVDIVVASEVHTTLETAVITAGLAGTLSGEGPFTVFAPTDNAFAALPDGTVDALLADSAALANVLLYHAVGAEAYSDDLEDGQRIMTLQGGDVVVTISDDGIFINDAEVSVANIQALNGVVHVIDAVLTPPPATVVDIIANSGVHNTLESAVGVAGLGDALSGEGPFTVFAPTDAAFAALPDGVLDALIADSAALANVLLYHVAGTEAYSDDLEDGQRVMTLQGGDVVVSTTMGLRINDVDVILGNIQALNGVVHVIDAVLTPPPATVVDIIVESEVHTTLETAVGVAGLAGALSGEGPFTVFAPTDDAFAALPDGALDALLADSAALANVLLYHVAGLEAYSDDLEDGQRVMTLQGGDVVVTINDDGVFINDAEVTLANIQALNGVVHVIDAVLTPPPATVVDIVVESEVHTTLETAVIEAGLAGTLSGEGPFTVFAPTDDAFAALPDGALDALLADSAALANVLLYHVAGLEAYSDDLEDGQRVMTLQGGDVVVTINDDGVFINDAEVTLANIQALNGVVHVIDAVLTPPPATVVDIIVNSEAHDTLEIAVIEAMLDDDLSGEGPFTVFAPTDDAFAALPAGTLDELLSDPTGALATILLFHVSGTETYAADLSDGDMLLSLEGENLDIVINDDGVFVENAQITMTDIQALNGVVHVIDAVMLPMSVSTEEPSFAEDVRILPNPTQTVTNVELPQEIIQSATLRLLDMNGRVLSQRKARSTVEQFDVSTFPAGTYLLQIQADAGIAYRRIVVQR
ncbi:fasciclin domain-containing protein [Lewinella sp. W8]|uniref:fasciclin domain-containing protein n=1 Tax=Lewinella sp. W8 TaxID=2528208 RepID=UPI0010689500|nr:fasciclin domain-containing protein [Lewinella sp. W8]MTB52329.1 T9SS type A sorting domain-containing protein [Lewinella sp. W8]